MSVILDFTESEMNQLKESWKQHKKIGSGNDGDCFLVGNEVYKILNTEYKKDDNIFICKNDLELDSFLFPTEIYTCNDYIFAYKTPYIPINQLKLKEIRSGNIPDINKFKKAIDSLMRDISVLSKNNIAAIDLSWRNALFDGERFQIIDTLDYEIVEEDPYKDNIESLKDIITCFILDCELANQMYHISKEDLSLDECKKLIKYIDDTSSKEIKRP